MNEKEFYDVNVGETVKSTYDLQIFHVSDLWGQILEVIVSQVQGTKSF
jgi:hypothetical protein